MAPLHISERGRLMPASPIRKLMPLADEARRQGTRVHGLNIGQPDLETPAVMRAKLRSAPNVYAYSPSAGTPECLETLAAYYGRLGIELSPDEIIVTTGGSEAILFALTACAGEGDEALVVEPFYTNYAAFATMAGVRLVPLRARSEDGFHLPAIEEWIRALTPRTRLVLLCNPNNPTGTVYRRQELEAIVELCRTNGLFVVADEVYREFVYDGRSATSLLDLPGAEDVAVVVDSLSKRYSACGIRLGCLVSRNREVHGAALRMAQARLSPPGLAQLVALGAAELPPDYVDGVVREYQDRRDILFEGLRRLPGVTLQRPEGAFYFVVGLPVDDSEDFAAWLLRDFRVDGETVLVAPATGFYATRGLGSDEVRIAYVLKKESLKAAVRVLERAVPAYREARGLGPIAAAPGAEAKAR